ncbi:hypothetical protein O5D80_001976 [Batrachochytrium dendrobatidis]|nr:hypothetical protein O5D80_001976 [Batrachochytrium dendrobatidis]
MMGISALHTYSPIKCGTSNQASPMVGLEHSTHCISSHSSRKRNRRERSEQTTADLVALSPLSARLGGIANHNHTNANVANSLLLVEKEEDQDMEVVASLDVFQSSGMDIDSDKLAAHSIYALTSTQLSAARSLARDRLCKALYLDIQVPVEPDEDQFTTESDSTISSRRFHLATPLRRTNRKLPVQKRHTASFSLSMGRSYNPLYVPDDQPSQSSLKWDNMEYTFNVSAPLAQNLHQSLTTSSSALPWQLPPTQALTTTDGTTKIFVTDHFPIPAFVFYCCRYVLKEVCRVGAHSQSVVRVFNTYDDKGFSNKSSEWNAVVEAVNKDGLLAFLEHLDSVLIDPCRSGSETSNLLNHLGIMRGMEFGHEGTAHLKIGLGVLHTHLMSQNHLIPKVLEPVFQGILAVNQATGTAPLRRDSTIRTPNNATRRLLRDALLLVPSAERNLLQFISLFGTLLTSGGSDSLLSYDGLGSKGPTRSTTPSSSNYLLSSSPIPTPMAERSIQFSHIASYFAPFMCESSTHLNQPISSTTKPPPWASGIIELLIICDTSTESNVSIWTLSRSAMHEIRSQMLTMRTPSRFMVGGVTPRRQARYTASKRDLSSAKKRLFKGMNGGNGKGSSVGSPTGDVSRSASPFTDTLLCETSDIDGEQRNKKRRRLA